MMKLYATGSVVAELFGHDGVEVYSLIPSPRFTALNGGAYAPLPDAIPSDAVVFNEEKFVSHIVARRRAAGVKFAECLAAHRVLYPNEAERDEVSARELF